MSVPERSHQGRSVAALRVEQTQRIVQFVREEASNDLAWTALARQHFGWIADRIEREFGAELDLKGATQ